MLLQTTASPKVAGGSAQATIILHEGEAQALQIAAGLAFSFFYAFVFESLGRAGIDLGALLGVFHALMLLVVIAPVLPAIHPRMARVYEGPILRRLLEQPGFCGSSEWAAQGFRLTCDGLAITCQALCPSPRCLAPPSRESGRSAPAHHLS